LFEGKLPNDQKCEAPVYCLKFENGVLRRTFRPKRDEIIGGWRKLHNEKLHNLYSSLSVIIMIKSRKMMGRALSTHIGEEECV
jgi:hypothetical protein